MMTAIHPIERAVMYRLQTELQANILLFAIAFDQIQRIVGKTIRPGANGQPHDLRMFESLVVEFLELRGRGISVGGGLKVRQEPSRLVSILQDFYAAADLLANGRAR